MKRKVRKIKVVNARGLIMDKSAFKTVAVKTITVLGKKVEIVDGITFIRIGNQSKKLQGSSLFAAFDKKLQEFFVKQMLVFVDIKERNLTERYARADNDAIDFILKRYKNIDKVWLYDSLVEVFKSDNPKMGRSTQIMNYIRLRESAKKLKLIKEDAAIDKLEQFKSKIQSKNDFNDSYGDTEDNFYDIEIG